MAAASSSPTPSLSQPARGGKPQLAAGTASAGANNAANFFVDFRNNISEGTISLDVDGERKWFQNLEVSRPSDTLGAAMTLSGGAHKVTVTLLNGKGEVRDTKSINLGLIDPATPRTLQIRLSRFKKNIELQSIARKPEDQAKPGASAAAKPEVPVSKPAAPGSKPAAPVSKPAAPVSKPTDPVSKPTEPVSKPAAPASKPAAPASKPAAPPK
jgi:hypothetical protein